MADYIKGDPNPLLISEMVNMMEEDPEAPVALTPREEELVYAEIKRRADNKKRIEDQRVRDIVEAANFEAKMAPMSANTLSNRLLDPSTTEGAALQGAIQGGTLMFGDEAVGAINAIKEAAGNPSLSSQEAIDAYTSARDVMRGGFEKAMESSPIATTGSMIGAGIVGPGSRSPTITGGIVGAGAAEDIKSIPMSATEGAVTGNLLGRAGKWAGQKLSSGASAVMSKADDLLAQALDIPSDELIKYKQSGILDDILSAVRRSSGPLGGAQRARENIEMANVGRPGSLSNPDLTVPQLEGPPGQSLEATMNRVYNKSAYPDRIPAPNQMPEAERIASRQLGQVADKSGGGLLPRSGITPSTFQGGITSAAMAKAPMAIGVGGHKLASKMKDIIGRGDQAAGMSRALSGKMMQLIDAVFNSENVDLEDYLAQEMSPEYKAIKMEAQSELEKEESQ